MNRKIKQQCQGFTLIEIVLVIGIVAFILVAMIQLYIRISAQSAMAGSKTLALSEAQSKIETIRNHTFDSIAADYASGGTPGAVFTPTLLTGKGRVTITSTNTELLVVEVVVCWQDKNNRVIGEDKNLSGALDGGEDANGNGKIDSPVLLITMLTRK